MTSHPRPGAIRALLVLVLLAWPAGGVLAQGDPAGREYYNDAFGYTVDLSGGLLAQYRAVTSPDGITLTSPDGGVVVEVFGSWNETDRTLGSVVTQYKREVPDARFTYEWQGANAAVLSGYQGDDIFYVRIAMSRDRSRAAVLSMIYAAELKQHLDAVVSRLSRSLSIR
jgi:hypothetical protein